MCVCVCTLMHLIQLPGDAASSHPPFLPSYHPSSEYPEKSQRSTEITVDVYLQQFKTFNFSERALRGAMVFNATRRTAVKSGQMQWDPLSSEMPQIESHSPGTRQPPYLDL